MYIVCRLPRICNNAYKLSIFSNLRLTSKRLQSSKVLDVNTNVTKDVILFKYDNNKFFRALNLFAICQFGFWTYLSFFTYNNLKDAPVEKTETVWWKKINLGENKYRNTLTILSFLIGWGCLAISWTFTLKSVKYLILRKGGKELTIVTYTPLGPNRMFTLGLENVSCAQARATVKSQLPIKVNGHYLHYLLDMKGEFRNTTLFDNTAGLRRKFVIK